LRFPFWILTPSCADTVAPPEVTENRPLAFSSEEKMRAFLEQCPSGQWDARLVSRYSAKKVVAELMERGLRQVCLDPNSDGSGGIFIRLSDIIVDSYSSD
jgi:hypothetical protein